MSQADCKFALRRVQRGDRRLAATRPQAFGQSWAADYTAADGFIGGAFTCGSFHPASTSNSNQAEFCNHKIDAEITRARRLQTTDNPAASKLWSRIDHDIVDQAPCVPVYNSRIGACVSRRVGNYQFNPQWRVLYDQLWVR